MHSVSSVVYYYLSETLLNKRKDKIALLTFFPPGCSSPKLIPWQLLQTIKRSFAFELFNVRGAQMVTLQCIS